MLGDLNIDPIQAASHTPTHIPIILTKPTIKQEEVQDNITAYLIISPEDIISNIVEKSLAISNIVEKPILTPNQKLKVSRPRKSNLYAEVKKAYKTAKQIKKAYKTANQNKTNRQMLIDQGVDLDGFSNSQIYYLSNLDSEKAGAKERYWSDIDTNRRKRRINMRFRRGLEKFQKELTKVQNKPPDGSLDNEMTSWLEESLDLLDSLTF